MNKRILIEETMKTSITNRYRAVMQSCSLITCCMLLFNLHMFSQGKNEEVTVIAPYIPSIGDATKIPFRPEIKPETEEAPEFDYGYITKKLDTRLELDPLELMKYSVDKQDKLYRNFAKVGLGNYVTPYIDFMASSLQSGNFLIGARLKHHSSQGHIKGYPVNAYSHNLAAVYGKYFTRTHTIAADAGYKRDVVHFYGFMPDSFPSDTFAQEDLKQRFQHIHGAVEIRSNYRDSDKLNHMIGFEVHYFTDYYDTREAQVRFDIGLDKEFEVIGRDYTHSFALDLGMNYESYKDTLKSESPLFFKIRQVYRFSFSQYKFEAGLDIEMASMMNDSTSSFRIDVFPVLKAEVVIVEEKLKAYAEITGTRTINTFRSLAQINPYMVSTPEIKPTDEQIKIGGGLTGNAGGMNFLVEASYAYINDMPLYVTDTSVIFENKFAVEYDDIELLKIKASLGYVKSKELSARLFAAYYHYMPKNEEKAWQLPNFEVGLEAGYTFLEKYTVRGSILALGSKYARLYESGEEVAGKMNGALDLGVGFEYQVNRMLAFFADGNNLLNQHYQRWHQYPVQGIFAMAGVKISF